MKHLKIWIIAPSSFLITLINESRNPVNPSNDQHRQISHNQGRIKTYYPSRIQLKVIQVKQAGEEEGEKCKVLDNLKQPVVKGWVGSVASIRVVVVKVRVLVAPHMDGDGLADVENDSESDEAGGDEASARILIRGMRR